MLLLRKIYHERIGVTDEGLELDGVDGKDEDTVEEQGQVGCDGTGIRNV